MTATGPPATTARAGTPPEPRRRHVFVLAALSAFGPLTTDVYLPGLPGLTRSLGTTAAAAQLTLTACVIGLAVGQVLIGPLSDAIGRRRPLLAGLAVFVLASLLCAAAPSLPILIVGRLAQGVAGAAGIVVARAMVRDLYHGVEAVRTFSTLSAILAAGPIVAPIVGAALLVFTGWREIFVALAVIGVALFATALLMTTETLAPARRRPRAIGGTFVDFRVLVGHRHFIGYTLAGALGFGAFFAFISASSFVYQGVFGISAQLYSVLFALNGVTLLAATLLNRGLVSRFDPHRLVLAGLCMLAASGIFLSVSVLAGAGAGVVLPLLLLTAAGTGLSLPNSLALAMEGEGERAGAASALFGLLQFGLGAVLAPLVGVAGDSAMPMAVAIAGSSLLALAAFFFVSPARPAVPDENGLIEAAKR